MADDDEPEAHCADEGGRDDRRHVANCHHRYYSAAHDDPRRQEPQRKLAASDARISARPERLRALTDSTKPNERRNREHQHGRDPDGIGSRQPCNATAAGDNHKNHRGGGDINSPCGSSEAGMKRCEARW